MDIVVHVKHGGVALEVSLPHDATVGALLQELEARTGLLARKQKLICKGKTVSVLPPKTALAQAGVGAGSKLLLLAASGTASQGAAALQTSQQARAAALRQRRDETMAQRPSAPPQVAMQARAATWAKTGIAALRDLKLSALPPELFVAPAATLRVLDLGGNQLSTLPPTLSTLTALQKLRLSINALTDAGMPWEALASLRQLAVLALDSNKLTALPDCISALSRLEKLSAERNEIAALPPAVGALSCLRALSLRGNRLTALPPALGACVRLEEADFSGNRIEELPPQLGALSSLRTLLLDDTMVRSVPAELLTGASSLCTLSLHGCPVTVEALREAPGWAAFDARRRAKHDKQVDMRVLLRGKGFDEGADAQEWEHWRGAP